MSLGRTGAPLDRTEPVPLTQPSPRARPAEVSRDPRGAGRAEGRGRPARGAVGPPPPPVTPAPAELNMDLGPGPAEEPCASTSSATAAAQKPGAEEVPLRSGGPQRVVPSDPVAPSCSRCSALAASALRPSGPLRLGSRGPCGPASPGPTPAPSLPFGIALAAAAVRAALRCPRPGPAGAIEPCGPCQPQLLQGPSPGAPRPALSFPVPRGKVSRSRELRGLGVSRGRPGEFCTDRGQGLPLPGSDCAVVHSAPPREHVWLPAASPGFWEEDTRHVESDVFRYPWKQNKI